MYFDDRMTTGSAPALGAVATTSRVRLRARVCPAAMLTADLLCVRSRFMSGVRHQQWRKPAAVPARNREPRGNGRGLAWLGHAARAGVPAGLFRRARPLTTRVPAWAHLGDVVVATIVALACDIFMTVAIYERPVLLERLRGALYCPCLLVLRMAMRHILRSAGPWSRRTPIVEHGALRHRPAAADGGHTRSAFAAATALGVATRCGAPVCRLRWCRRCAVCPGPVSGSTISLVTTS